MTSISYKAKASFAFQTPKGSHGLAVQDVSVKKKSEVHIIVVLKEMFGIANYELLNVYWEKV